MNENCDDMKKSNKKIWKFSNFCILAVKSPNDFKLRNKFQYGKIQKIFQYCKTQKISNIEKFRIQKSRNHRKLRKFSNIEKFRKFSNIAKFRIQKSRNQLKLRNNSNIEKLTESSNISSKFNSIVCFYHYYNMTFIHQLFVKCGKFS